MSVLRIRRPGRLAAEAAALLIAAAVAFPLYWMVLSALKPAGEIQSTDPRPWTLSPSLDSFRRLECGEHHPVQREGNRGGDQECGGLGGQPARTTDAQHAHSSSPWRRSSRR